MSIEASNAVWKYSKQKKSGALLILLAIADYQNAESGLAFPAMKKLAKKVRMSVRNVQRWINELKRDGELEILRKSGPHGTNYFRITISPKAGPVVGVGDAHVAVDATRAPIRGEARVAQTVSQPLKEATSLVPKGDEEFWIKICFECFKQELRPLHGFVTKKLSRLIRFLDKSAAGSLLEFYKYRSFNSQPPPQPYSSRRHSPERLILDLPRQLALAMQACPPPPPKKPEPPAWREFVRWKYPHATELPSFYDLPQSVQEAYRTEFRRRSDT